MAVKPSNRSNVTNMIILSNLVYNLTILMAVMMMMMMKMMM